MELQSYKIYMKTCLLLKKHACICVFHMCTGKSIASWTTAEYFFAFFPTETMVHGSVSQEIWLNLENFFYADCGRKYYNLLRKFKCIPNAHFIDICSCNFIIILKDSKDCWFVFSLSLFAITHVQPFMFKYLCEE